MAKRRLLSILVLLAAVVTGAWAQSPEKKIYSVDFSDYTSYPFYNENESATVENGLLVLTNSKVYTQQYDVQPEIGRPTPITAGKCYRIAIEYKSTVGGPVSVVLGAQDWSTMMGAWWLPITVSDNFQTLEATYLKCNYGATDNHILFQYGNLVGTVYIKKVEVYEFDYVDVTSVTLSSSTATMTVDKKVALTATVAPDNATEKIVKWSVGGTNADAVKLYTDEACTTEVGSDATNALTVYAKGMSVGKATVKAESGADATKSATCTITVNPTFSATLKEGTEDAEKWTISPAEGLEGGETVTVTYNGEKKVKSVKAVKKAAKPADLGHALSASAVGEIVGSDGKAYAVADKDNLPSGVTAVAMVAYKSGSNGLAIQLNDISVKMKWADAKTYVEELDAVSGGTWRLPSKADWQNMFVGCAVSGDASASDDMNPIAGFKAKIAATGITWQTRSYWSSTGSDSSAWLVGVNLGDSTASATFIQGPPTLQMYVRACLAF